MITVRIRTFAMLREITGSGALEMSLPDESTVDALVEKLVSAYPALERWRAHVRCAVNNEYTNGSHVLRNNDEAAFIPPVSGG